MFIKSKKSISDEKIAEKVSEEDKKEIENAVADVQQWLEKNLSAEKDEIEHQKQEFEKKVTPIMTKIYQGAQQGGGMPGGFPSGAGSEGFQSGGMPNQGSGGQSREDQGPKIEEVD